MTNPRVLATVQTYLCQNKWGEKRILAQADGRDCIKIPLSQGGDLCIYPDMIPLEVAKGLTQEILGKPGIFRHYLIQGINKEPRVHAQFHQDATADFNQRQPGYRYNQSVTAKARPLSTFATLETLHELAKKAGGVKQWKIGATVVVYRDGNDKMGQHADDDQGEELILAAVIDAPTLKPREVQIMTKIDRKAGEQFHVGAERICLYLKPGDGYSMDGEMQKYYTHGVAPETKQGNPEFECGPSSRRIAVIFREGRYVEYDKDSGWPCSNLEPRLKGRGPVFGHTQHLKEGNVYSRRQMTDTGTHLGQQRGISGNRVSGCDAIVVSGGWDGSDHFHDLVYTANSRVGAGALEWSFRRSRPIRLFRSSEYQSEFRAVKPAGCLTPSPTVYRYDGLYIIVSKKIIAWGEKGDPLMTFHFIRCGSSWRGVYQNRISNKEFLYHCLDLGTIPAKHRIHTYHRSSFGERMETWTAAEAAFVAKDLLQLRPIIWSSHPRFPMNALLRAVELEIRATVAFSQQTDPISRFYEAKYLFERIKEMRILLARK